ncbi:hypothetical protein [Mastigocoleus testarum]|uniref:Uncharacterized protein n=1 Tax=Mastigocoleus testarum BC008 TaxID=371196 RepID=A0A0V7ZUH8_9CYAN|nr:hypothetical protein [Mastigocoleus testarum]KST68126.1 hypothetical protein BC008_32380 [Mastigocoleus testarum BC008]KST68789.1 hypothetical protein BC008_34065 [Mastigocoleus testarum BC008]
MTIKVMNEQQVLQEAMEVLITHLEPSKVLKFWSACKLGKGDYLQLKDKVFDKETVASLYEQIKIHQDSH